MSPITPLKVKVVLTALTTDTAGKVVEAVPVRVGAGSEVDSAGNPVAIVPVIEDDTGLRVIVVEEIAVENLAGQMVDSMPVSGLE